MELNRKTACYGFVTGGHCFWGRFKFGFIGALKIEIVGADVLDGPMPTREDSLSGKGYLRGVEDVSPYIWVT